MRTQGSRYGWRAALIFPNEYFATASGSASASISGVSGAANAGTVSASGTALALPTGAATVADAGEIAANGNGLAEIAGAGASAQAGELGAFTASTAVAGIAGVEATATAGAVSAGIRPAETATSGGARRWQDVYIPPASLPATVHLRGAGVKASVSPITARSVNVARVSGAGLYVPAGGMKAAGTAVAGLRSASISARANKSAADGTWPITDSELVYFLLHAA